MHDRIEAFLQIDAFAQAVGADQNALRSLSQVSAIRSSRSLGGSVPVTPATVDAARRLAQCLRHIIHRRDETAEDNRVVAVAEQCL